MTSRSLLAPARLAGQSVLRTQTDERLADLARAGSKPAFEAIVARYRRPLLGYCVAMLSEARADDAVQQTFVKAYSALTGGEVVLKLRPWLYRIAHNTALNSLRDRALHHVPLDERIDGVERPDQAAERRQELGEVIAAVKSLPERQRDAIVLRELEGRNYDEIAKQLGVTDGAVRQLLNRARTSLRAGATALTPIGLLARLGAPLADAPVGLRVAEVCGAAGGAAAAKVCATALVTGAIAGGAGGAPAERPQKAERQTSSTAAVARSVRADTHVAAPASTPDASAPRAAAGSSAPRKAQPRAGRPARRREPSGERRESEGERRERYEGDEPERQQGEGKGDAPHHEQLAYRRDDAGAGGHDGARMRDRDGGGDRQSGADAPAAEPMQQAPAADELAGRLSQ